MEVYLINTIVSAHLRVMYQYLAHVHRLAEGGTKVCVKSKFVYNVQVPVYLVG